MARRNTARDDLLRYFRDVSKGRVSVPGVDKTKLPGCLDGMICTIPVSPADASVGVGEIFNIGKGVVVRVIGAKPTYGNNMEYQCGFFYLH